MLILKIEEKTNCPMKLLNTKNVKIKNTSPTPSHSKFNMPRIHNLVTRWYWKLYIFSRFLNERTITIRQQCSWMPSPAHSCFNYNYCSNIFSICIVCRNVFMLGNTCWQKKWDSAWNNIENFPHFVWSEKNVVIITLILLCQQTVIQKIVFCLEFFFYSYQRVLDFIDEKPRSVWAQRCFYCMKKGMRLEIVYNKRKKGKSSK